MKGVYAPHTADTSAGPSFNIWGDCPLEDALTDRMVGYEHWDDFCPVCPNTDAGLFEGAGECPGSAYGFYGDTGVRAKAQAGVVGGVLEVAGNDADNDEFVMSTLSPCFNISDTDADEKELWFEARVKKASLDDEACALFVGLGWDHTAGVSVAQTTCLSDNEADLGAFSFIGFHVDLSDGDAMDFVYQADGGAQTVLIAGVHVPVADTWVKVGFKYEPKAVPTEKIKIYVNGVVQSTFVTATQIAAATFPDAEPMAMVFCVKVGAAAESKAQMDWWRAFQMR